MNEIIYDLDSKYQVYDENEEWEGITFTITPDEPVRLSFDYKNKKMRVSRECIRMLPPNNITLTITRL